MKLKCFFYNFLIVILVSLGAFDIWLSRHAVVPILMYHHVDAVEHVDPLQSSNTISPERFEWQMKYLKDHRFHVISFDQFMKARKDKSQLPHKAVVITFDDGYEDNYTEAFPILKKYGFPATIFLVSDLINTPGFLTLEEVKEMAAHRIEMGSHTRTHVYLPEVSAEKQWDQIKGSKDILEKQLGRPVKYFCYPSGGFSDAIKTMVRQAGYHAAVTTNRGSIHFNKDTFGLKRIRLSEQDNRNDFLWVKLSGYYNFFRRLKKCH